MTVSGRVLGVGVQCTLSATLRSDWNNLGIVSSELLRRSAVTPGSASKRMYFGVVYLIFPSRVYAVCPYANLLGTSSMYPSPTGAVSGLRPSSWGEGELRPPFWRAFGLGDNSDDKNTLV